MKRTKEINLNDEYKVEKEKSSGEVSSCTSHCIFLGYSLETLRVLEEDGYTLYMNGKPRKFPTAAEYKKAMQL